MAKPKILAITNAEEGQSSFAILAHQLKRLISEFEWEILPFFRMQQGAVCDLLLPLWWRPLAEGLADSVTVRRATVGAVMDAYSWTHTKMGHAKMERALAEMDYLVAGTGDVHRGLLDRFTLPPSTVCQMGVDTRRFKLCPLPSGFTVGWAGNSKATHGNDIKGLGLVRQACEMAGIPLKVADFAGVEGEAVAHQDMPAWYAGISCLAIASEMEVGPLPLLEALAMGRPVCTTRVGLAHEVILHGINGCMVQRDADSMESGIRWIRERVGQAPGEVQAAARLMAEAHDERHKIGRWRSVLRVALGASYEAKPVKQAPAPAPQIAAPVPPVVAIAPEPPPVLVPAPDPEPAPATVSAPLAPVIAPASREHVVVSVISGTYNRLKSLKRFVASVRSSVGDYKYKIVLADGGSTDGTREWISEQGDCRLVEGGLTGAIDAFNAAYSASVGEFIYNGNDDTTICGDGLAVAVQHLQENPEVDQVVFSFSRDGGKTFKHEAVDPQPHPNLALTRRVALENVIAKEMGAFWGDKEHRSDKTYGGDTYQWVALARHGHSAIALDSCKAIDHLHVDGLRGMNEVLDRDGHWSNFNRITGLASGREKAFARIEPGPDEWPNLYVAERGKLPRRSPIEGGPQERILVIHLGYRDEPQADLRRALAAIGPSSEVAYAQIEGQEQRMEAAVRAAASLRPTLVWAQVQVDGQFPVDTWDAIRAVSDPSCILTCWSGDVRRSGTQPPEDWALELSAHFDLALVSNNTHPISISEHWQRAGVDADTHRAGYLPCGYDPFLSAPCLDEKYTRQQGGILFSGTNYTWLDGGYRQALFERLAQAIPGQLKLFGLGWNGSAILAPLSSKFVPQEQCAKAYAAHRISIAVSLFNDLRRYTSDRLKRMLGSGACTAMRAFDDYEGLGIRDGVHALVWRDAQDLIELCKDWMRPERNAERKQMRREAHELAKSTMTNDCTVEYLLAIVRSERARRALKGNGIACH